MRRFISSDILVAGRFDEPVDRVVAVIFAGTLDINLRLGRIVDVSDVSTRVISVLQVLSSALFIHCPGPGMYQAKALFIVCEFRPSIIARGDVCLTAHRIVVSVCDDRHPGRGRRRDSNGGRWRQPCFDRGNEGHTVVIVSGPGAIYGMFSLPIQGVERCGGNKYFVFQGRCWVYDAPVNIPLVLPRKLSLRAHDIALKVVLHRDKTTLVILLVDPPARIVHYRHIQSWFIAVYELFELQFGSGAGQTEVASGPL